MQLLSTKVLYKINVLILRELKFILVSIMLMLIARCRSMLFMCSTAGQFYIYLFLKLQLYIFHLRSKILYMKVGLLNMAEQEKYMRCFVQQNKLCLQRY